ncbi:MAG: type II secretion system protein [Victivallales bacterium]|jgi:hypothetical protein
MNKNNNGQKTKTSGKDGTMRKRFTILELLIVVSVIAILAGMMLPALNKAKQTAGKLSCVNNLKSIGAAQAMYSGDYADWIVPMRASSHPYGVWYCRLTGVKEISGNPDMPGVPPYGVRYFMYSDKRAKLSTFRCPGAKYGIEQYKYTHFTLNAILAGSFGSSYLLAHKSGNVKSPSVTIFAGDAANAGGTSGENIYRFAYRHDGYDLRDDGDPASSAQYSTASPGPSKTNLLYFDGHVQTVAFSTLLAMPRPDGASAASNAALRTGFDAESGTLLQ